MKYIDYLKYAKELLNQNKYIKYNKKIEDETLSFTPYIYNECSASCRFCSEQLIRNGKAMVCHGVCENYFDKLRKVLGDLHESELFLSLSGKEPTESLDFLEGILKCVEDFETAGGQIVEKVMYSNLSGLIENMTKMGMLIEVYGIDRIECSRHHFDEVKNQSIMRFKNQPIQKNEIFQQVMEELLEHVDVKQVCVVQKGGIDDVEQLKTYLEWAKSMGVSQVVFRELALFDDTVEMNATARYIVNNRIEIKEFLEGLDESFKLVEITEGYYYMSFGYEYEGMKLWFEMSDYEEMEKKHGSNKVYKMIYYPNGKLCLDWNMNQEIL